MFGPTPPPSPPYDPSNLARRHLHDRGADLLSWWGCCTQLAEAVVDEQGRGVFLYIEPQEGKRIRGLGGGKWRCHVAPVIDGIVHDAWSPRPPAPVAEYIKTSYPGESIRVCIIPTREGLATAEQIFAHA